MIIMYILTVIFLSPASTAFQHQRLNDRQDKGIAIHHAGLHDMLCPLWALVISLGQCSGGACKAEGGTDAPRLPEFRGYQRASPAFNRHAGRQGAAGSGAFLASWGSGLGIPRLAGRILSARPGPAYVRALVSRWPTAAGPAGDTTLHSGPDQRGV
jgi:hypothetical protein